MYRTPAVSSSGGTSIHPRASRCVNASSATAMTPATYSRMFREWIRRSKQAARRRTSSNVIVTCSTSWFCQKLLKSFGFDSMDMAGSLLEIARQDLLDAVNFRRCIPGGQTRQLGDTARVNSFQVRQNDGAIQRLQTSYQRSEPFDVHLAIGVRRDRPHVDFVEADERTGARASLLHCPRDRGVMRHAVDPSSQRAAPLECFEAAPQRQMDLLQQIAAPVGIGLIGIGQTS